MLTRSGTNTSRAIRALAARAKVVDRRPRVAEKAAREAKAKVAAKDLEDLVWSFLQDVQQRRLTEEAFVLVTTTLQFDAANQIVLLIVVDDASAGIRFTPAKEIEVQLPASSQRLRARDSD